MLFFYSMNDIDLENHSVSVYVGYRYMILHKVEVP